MATVDRLSRQPSMIEAWFSSSESTVTPGPPTTDSTPRLAAKPVANSAARSWPFQSANSSSSSRWTGRPPTMRRAEPLPAPDRSRAAWAAAITAGCWVRPR